MANHPQVWLLLNEVEEPVRVAPLSFECPFCSHPVGTLLGGGIMVGRRCPCGAVISRISDNESAESPAGVMAEAFRQVQSHIRRTVVGHDAAVARLALLGARHLHRGGRQRALIIGPSGTGKTTMAGALADALHCPVTIWDVSVSSEVGWSGVTANDVFSEMYAAYDNDPDQTSRGILLLDEIDKLAIGDAKGTSREHRRGQQKSLLGIAGGGVPVRFRSGGDSGATISLLTDNMLIIGLGAFEGLPPDPGPAELVAYGFLPEFASRFPVTISLSELDERALVAVLRRDMEPYIRAAAEFGYEISISEPVLGYVATAVRAGASSGVTPRAGIGWLQTAVDEALVRLLDLDARPGTAYQIRPDDVPIPVALRRGRRG